MKHIGYYIPILLLLGLLINPFTQSVAQTPYEDFKGAIYDAQAGAAVSMGSPLAIYTNPADLIYSAKLGISASAKNYFFGEDGVWSGILAGSFALSQKDAMAVAISTLGNSSTRYTSISAGYAHKLGANMGLGLTVNGHHYAVNNYESNFTGSIDIGFRAAVYPYLHLEASIHNPYEIGNIDYKQIKSSLNFQVLYEIGKSVQWTTALKKSWRDPLSISTAIGVKLSDSFVVYAGGGFSPSQVGMGIRYEIGKLNLMTSSRYRAPLGFSPSIEMEYKSN